MASVPAYQASGLASNLDTQGIIEKLVAIEGQPLATLATKQSAISVKISSIGSLISSLETMSTQAKLIGTSGLSAVAVGGSYSDFNVAGAPANPGRYAVKVEDMARAAKARSTTVYHASTDEVTATNKDLKLSVDGTIHTIAVTAGTTLSQLVTQINGAEKPFTAALVSDGSQYYITLTRKDSGYVVGQAATSALSVVNELGVDMDLGLGLSSPADLQAKNSIVHVDGLRIERRTNELTDVVPGTTLSLKAASNSTLDLVFNPDTASSTGMLQVLVNNYNKVATFLKSQMDSNPQARQSGDKLGSSIAYGMMRQLEKVIGVEVNATGTIRTLRDLGVKLQKDGTLKLESATLTAALAKDPTAVNQIFTKSGTGLGATIAAFVTAQTNTTGTDSTIGFLVSRRASLEKSTKAITEQASRVTTHLEAYRRQLNIQFSALENVMNGVNGIAKFLDAQDAQLRKK